MSQSPKFEGAALPSHVAIVMDGNGRWAKQRFMPRVAGHKQGVVALRKAVKHALDRGIQTLTVFAFSSENWSRPADEVNALMALLAGALSREVPLMNEQGVRLYFPGHRQGVSEHIAQSLAAAECATQTNRRLVLNVCFNYGGRWDIVDAAQRLAEQGVAITEASMAAATALAHVGDPDLLIRTGGERRISNFLLWQCAYTELVFSDVLWPDFGPDAMDDALNDFARRERRFGRTSDQLQTAGTGSHA
jgi:undecaprenyl diphosphate synthase